MSLYDDLGVRPDASPEQIKQAYRKLAMEYHPDRPGGNEAKFRKVQAAFDVLRDEAQRARYDETGETEEDCLMPEALQAIASMMNTILDEDEPVDPIAIMREAVKRKSQSNKMKLNAVTRKMNRETRLVKRFRNKKNFDQNVLSAMVEKRLEHFREEIKCGNRAEQVNELVLEILEDYEFTPSLRGLDLPKPV